MGAKLKKIPKLVCLCRSILLEMTIGNLGNSLSATDVGENPDFSTLSRVRKEVSEATNISEEDMELSMGMSNDFEEAIKMGSTNVRVGSSIFGARNYATTGAL